MFRSFENRIPPYPKDEPQLPPKGFVAFLWACTRGMRGWIFLLMLCSAAMSVYEAFLFGVMSHVVDWLATTPPGQLWEVRRGSLLGVGAILLGSIAILALQTMVKHQVLAINFPMRMRWVFHRLMLGQSMSFYADEFAGRITTKIMQTALSVREVVFIVVDVLVGVAVFFVSILLLAVSFDITMLLPFGLWLLA
ncbi:MAG: ABC transporter ATP-binding protein, partial [Comamonas sp.]|nr:ABC transporter ATP-binding protein [Candidatus Comamonas equi]